MKDCISPPPFWSNGPSPGAFYDFPKTSFTPDSKIFKVTTQPMTTGTSVVGTKFDGGVVIAADVLGSYGSLARFRQCTRVLKVNDNIILGAGGDYADYQYLKDIIEQKIIDEDCLDDGFNLKPKSLYCWLTRILYSRRSKLDPFWNNFIVGGLQNDEPFLGSVDKLGTAFEDDVIATGYGAFIALPVMREFMQKKRANGQEITKEDAEKLLVNCMEILYYRDARSYPKFDMITITKDGVEVKEKLEIKGNWELANIVDRKV